MNFNYPVAPNISGGDNSCLSDETVKISLSFFGKNYAVMPAFSVFTGLYNIRSKAGERIFEVTKERVAED